MKKSTLNCMILGLLIMGVFFTGNAQNFSSRHKAAKAVKLPSNNVISQNDDEIGIKPPNVCVSKKSVLDDPSTMMTKYDLQTNGSSGQQRIYLWPDGKICAGATWSHQDAAWIDRGTGYNFFDDTTWGSQPVARQESVKTGWPSLQPFGPEGECLLAHQSAITPLIFLKRSTKGTGTWTESYLPVPPPATGMLWPRMVTNGTDHTCIHIIALTAPEGNGGVVYNGMDGALLYIRSLDGGTTWSDWQQLNGMTSAEYINFTSDMYAWAQPIGDILAFTVGNSWQDQFLMKSMDNGTTWTKTIIWPCPYNFWNGGDSVPRYYCPDGTMHVALDQQGMAHIVFGLTQESGSVAGDKYWVPYTDGVIYWNEYMTPFPEILDPQTLQDNGNYIGWVKDTMVFYPPTGVRLAHYYCSMTSNPGITIDADNNIFVIWSGITPLLDPDNFYLRHIFERSALIQPDHSIIWGDSLTDLTGDFLQYNGTECMYPNIAGNSDDKIYVLFQADSLAGCYILSLNITYQGQHIPSENDMIVLTPDKTDLSVGIRDKEEVDPLFTVSQNYPNPVTDLTTVNMNIRKPGNLMLEVTNLMGQKLISMEKVNLIPGTYRFVIDGNQLTSGVYFYTVKFNNESITNKMIIE